MVEVDGELVMREIDKVKIAIDRIRHFEPKDGYFVAFSGGKDSVVVLDLVKRSGVKHDDHYNLTTVGPPELVQFIKREHPEVERHRPDKTMWQILARKNMPPTRIVRYCCKLLKEGGGMGRVVITGIRWAESTKRSKRRMTENCLKDKMKTFIHPIIDWSNEEVWEYIKTYKIKYCNLYDEGFKRLGCVMCPMTGTKGMLREKERWPKIYEAYIRAFNKMALKNPDSKNWKTGKDIMDWWIYNPSKADSDQTIMFE